jgi:hypothetical protein
VRYGGVTVLLPVGYLDVGSNLDCARKSPPWAVSLCPHCCRIWTVGMIIVPNLRWRTFRFWAVRATDVRDMGSSPFGRWTFPPLTLTTKQAQQLSSSAPVTCKIHLQRKPKQK